jgi:type II secretory pathway component GspD/PulD (secretin)
MTSTDRITRLETALARNALCVAVVAALVAAGIARAQAPSQPSSTTPAQSQPSSGATSVAKPAAGPITTGAAAGKQPAQAGSVAPAPEPTADPGTDSGNQPQGKVWGVPGPNAAQGGVSTPFSGPGGRPAAPDAASAGTPSENSTQKPDARVDVTSAGRFSLSAQSIEVSKLLELISIKARQNIVASDKVKGLVTVNLYDVPLEEALNAVLNVNGLSWRREGDFIYVWTKGELDAQRKREARVFTLQFLSADDTIALVKPVLTDGGSAVALGKVEPGYTPTLENGGADSFAFAAKVMVNDYAEVVERVAKIIEELDTPPKQVRVEATILTVDLTDNTAFGMDISVVGNINFADVTSPLLAFDDIAAGKTKPATPSTANNASLYPVSADAPSPTAKIGVMTNDVAVFLQMLDQVVDTTVMARPTVTVLNRQRAQVLIGERIAYLSTTQTQTSTTQEVKYLDVGVKLIFRPFVSPDGMVRLELAPQVSTARIKNIDAAGGGKATVPDEISQELRTNVRVKSGQTIVLGGLFRETSSVTNRQIPGLGDLVPGAFSGASSDMKKQEIIFLITPTVVEDAQDYKAGDIALQTVDAAKVGARAGLLPFSQSHLAGNYQVQALEAWKKGDRSTALYYADQALRTEKNSPSMIALREAIRTDRKEQFRTELDSVELLDPLQREPHNGVPLSDNFKYAQGWVGPPTPKDLAKDVPPPVDDDYKPFDPLPLPDPDHVPPPGEPRGMLPAPAPAPAKEPTR